MKKKVLFVIGTLQSGGVSKSMVSLLNVWDKEKYDTSLLLCCKDGDVFSKYLPKGVRFIYDPVIEHVMGGFSSAKWLMRHGHMVLCFGVLLRLVLSRLSRPLAGELIARMMPVVCDEYYDLIVDYGGQQLLYYMVNKLKATKKVTFFHNDYSKWPYYYKADCRFYPKVDHIFSVSQVCVEVLKRYFPDCAGKISLMENISSPKVIWQQAEDIPDELRSEIEKWKSDGNTIFCTVAHFCRRKGSDLTIEAAELMKQKGMKFKWIFVGKVLEYDLVELVRIKGLENEMIFAGIQGNPYPYMLLADIYVQPSRFEGKSISLDEAKILCKPIVVTDFSTVGDQFNNRVNASICKMSGDAVAQAIMELINNSDLRHAYEEDLRAHVVDNSEEVSKLFHFL